MKALIISEDDAVTKSLSPVVKNCGYEVIVYRWLLKALDNIEEIAPDLIILSAGEYPRHWKTLVQFAGSGFSAQAPKTVLYSAEGLPDEEKRKARALGVSGMITSLEKSSLEQLRKIITAGKSDVFSESKIEFIFTNPKSGVLVTGRVSSFYGKKIEFIPDIALFTENLDTGDLIKNATFGRDKDYRAQMARLISKDQKLGIQLL